MKSKKFKTPKTLWKKLYSSPSGMLCIFVLGVLYFGAIFASFLAPYAPTDHDLKKTYHPPTLPVWHEGRFCVRVYKNVDPTISLYRPIEDEYAPIHFLSKAKTPYRFLGLITTSRKLIQVDAPNRIYLLGSDSTGRDVFSRLLFGSRVSLSVGLLGIAVSMTLGCLVGGLAGYFGGFWDQVAMRFTEVLMAVPGLYLLLALRSAFAEKFSSDEMYILIVLILSFIGWSGTARVVRGLALSLTQQPYVQAAQALGQNTLKILARHLLPNMFSYLIVAATLSIPGYILGETALSFLGIGIQEPSVSWGLMLSQAQDIKIFALNFWWFLLPGFAIFVTVIAFNIIGDVLRDIVDPKFNIHS